AGRYVICRAKVAFGLPAAQNAKRYAGARPRIPLCQHHKARRSGSAGRGVGCQRSAVGRNRHARWQGERNIFSYGGTIPVLGQGLASTLRKSVLAAPEAAYINLL